MNTSDKVTISKIDKERLLGIFATQENNTILHDNIRIIKEKLTTARLVAPNQMAPTVVTMNSRVEVKNLLFGKSMAVELVYPGTVDAKLFKISVLSPLGASMLGYSLGDEFFWKGRSSKNRFVIEKIIYQPESAGDYHL